MNFLGFVLSLAASWGKVCALFFIPVTLSIKKQFSTSVVQLVSAGSAVSHSTVVFVIFFSGIKLLMLNFCCLIIAKHWPASVAPPHHCVGFVACSI